jgi:hypothetical protein
MARVSDVIDSWPSWLVHAGLLGLLAWRNALQGAPIRATLCGVLVLIDLRLAWHKWSGRRGS